MENSSLIKRPLVTDDQDQFLNVGYLLKLVLIYTGRKVPSIGKS